MLHQMHVKEEGKINMPKAIISIIIPIYKVEKFLPQTLLSIQNQTFTDFEAICVNDGSPDNCLNIIKQFTKNDERFKLIDQHNSGISVARNAGINIATGKYIMFLDGDDYLHPQAMEFAYKTIEKSNADICDFGYEEVMEDEKTKFPCLTIDDYKSVSDVFLKYLKREFYPVVMVWNKIYKAEFVKKTSFKPYHPGEDTIWTFEILAKIKKFATFDNKLIYYVQNSKSIMHQISEEKFILNHAAIMYEISASTKQMIESEKYANLHGDLIHFLNDCHREVFKNLILKPLRQKMDIKIIQNNFTRYQQYINLHSPYLKPLKLKRRLIIWLLLKQYYTLARLLTK